LPVSTQSAYVISVEEKKEINAAEARTGDEKRADLGFEVIACKESAEFVGLPFRNFMHQPVLVALTWASRRCIALSTSLNGGVYYPIVGKYFFFEAELFSFVMRALLPKVSSSLFILTEYHCMESSQV
jgi:hypothetical protein